MTSPPKGIWGSCALTEPVAIIIFSARMICGPPSPSTSTVLPSINCAVPSTFLTPAFFKRPLTPPVNCATIPSFHAIEVFRSSVGDCREIPSGDFFAKPCTLSYSSATWMSAFDGIQPTLRHVPPQYCRSTIIVSRPSWPARMAATYPPGPAPITKVWHFKSDISGPAY